MINELPSTKKDAVAGGYTRYFTGVPCLRGHVAERSTASAMCIVCAYEKAKARVISQEELDRRRATKARYAAKNQERVMAAKKRYAEENREKIAERNRAKYAEDVEASRAYCREKYAKKVEQERLRSAAYREANREACNARIKDWAERNKDKARARVSKRRAARMDRIAGWELELTSLTEAEAHDKCIRLEQISGIKWHLDHVIPLQGRKVSGLHVWNNFQLLPDFENRRKLNKYEVAA